MRIIMSGGGTGGHIYPALAIADEIKHRQPGADILYIGSDQGMEADIIPRAGYPFRSVRISGLNRSSHWEALKALALVPGAVRKAAAIIKAFAPEVVVGTGGYASYPVLKAAVGMGLRTYIHEQNALPGLANRRLAGRVDEVFLTFPEALKYMKTANCRVTGFPVRKEIGSIRREEARQNLGLVQECFTLLVFGGSQGARRINQAVIDCLKAPDWASDLQIVWACGADNFTAVQMAISQGVPGLTGPNIVLKDYIHDMPSALAAADLALCRAGAGTISELALAGLPAILVPYPYAADNHQQKNAEAIAARSAAIMITDHQLDGVRLQSLLTDIRKDLPGLVEMSRQMKAQARPGAVDEIVDIILNI